MIAFLSRLLRVLGALPLIALLTSCGPGDSETDSGERLVVILDYLPGPIHAGFYAAEKRGEYAAAGLEIELRTPSSTSDTIRLMAAGQADLGLVPLLDFFHLRGDDRPVKLLMALVQVPLNAVITSTASGIASPRDLEGKTVATTGIIGDQITLNAVVTEAGGDPTQVETINVGFNTIQALSAGQVDAAFGFWNSEGVQYGLHHDAVVLRSYELGIPPYPELVLFTHEAHLTEKGDAIRKFLEITQASYERLLAQPEEALEQFADAVDGYSVESARPYFEALLPVFQHDAAQFGEIDPEVLQATLDWLTANGLPPYNFDAEALLAPGFTSVVAPE